MRTNAADIIGIGAQKSATSWAAHVLNLQEKVWIPAQHAHSKKEVMFWDKHYSKGEHWYARIMTPPDHDLKSMDVSPGYSRIGDARVARCRLLSPEARVFLILRNPIFRDWSSLCMEAKLRLNVDLSGSQLVDLFYWWDHTNVRQFSTYGTTIRRWRRYYGEQLFVGFYDDIVTDAHDFYRRLCEHCGLDPDAVPNWKGRIDKKVFVGPGLPLPREMHVFLRRKYKPVIDEVEELCGRDLSSWLSDDPAVR